MEPQGKLAIHSLDVSLQCHVGDAKDLVGVLEGHANLAGEGGGGHGRARQSGVAGALMIIILCLLTAGAAMVLLFLCLMPYSYSIVSFDLSKRRP